MWFIAALFFSLMKYQWTLPNIIYRAGNAFRLAVVLLVPMLVTGCNSSGGSAPLQNTSAEQAIVPPAQQAAPVVQQVLPVYVQVIKADLPLGTFTQNPQVQELLTPTTAGNSAAAIYSLNGFRAQSGRVDQWAKLMKLIGGKQSVFTNIFYRIGTMQPANVSLQQNIQNELLSYRAPNSELALRTYSSCDNALQIAAMTDPATGATHLDIQPVVQMGMVTFTRSQNTLGVLQGNQPITESPGDLQFSATIEPGEFFVLSPDISANNPTSIGATFLTHTSPPAVETVLFFAALKPTSAGH